jgi:hypothetical protein
VAVAAPARQPIRFTAASPDGARAHVGFAFSSRPQPILAGTPHDAAQPVE